MLIMMVIMRTGKIRQQSVRNLSPACNKEKIKKDDQTLSQDNIPFSHILGALRHAHIRPIQSTDERLDY